MSPQRCGISLSTGASKPDRGGRALHARRVAGKDVAHASRRSFHFVPYGKDCIVETCEGRSTICVDGLVKGVDLQLSHWTNNETPDHLYADLSTEIALKFAAGEGASDPRWADAVVVNNHYDTDGVLSVFALLHPQEALEHADLLIAGAEVGDFDEWPGDTRGLKLDAALSNLASCSTNDHDAYQDVLPNVLPVIQDLDSREDLWGPAWAELLAAEASVRANEVKIRRVGPIGVVVHPHKGTELPGPVLSKVFGGAHSGVMRYLLAFPLDTGSHVRRWRYKYRRVGHAWVTQTIVRPVLPAPDKEVMAMKLGTGWTVAEGLTDIIECNSSPLQPGSVVTELTEIDNTLK
mmetsp:Transcript_38622/g.74027  ORF Transcript_38622/g.74027 Transcript_38622/m.74027 type:complete len:349 (+) Transcript_38622:54-1100(+)|eukprot:CAMPEP_0114306742 /NCGR_PEP_ID=MMETSP0059-20121206/17068_1 /TAXON_ID=36894 /ORGANISM="Pyramimonas parkeae, Strain CCMP726" /LENGTH=348 /DNA_ID=CAMNT_0001430099 /DNA_START=44 /DNA_END=1090 /DNA_ORIENTATION=+